jgi:hypothetical protein
MKQTIREKIDAFERVELAYNRNAALFNSEPEIVAQKAIFDAQLLIIHTNENTQGEINEGLATDKKALKAAMTSVVIKFVLRGKVKATNLALNGLAKNLDKTKTYIAKASDEEAIVRAKNLRKILFDNASILTNISPADIAAIDATIAAFEDAKNKPQEQIEYRRAQGTRALNASVKRMDTITDNLYELLFSYFNDTNPNEVAEVKFDKQIINTGQHHTGIQATFTDEQNQTLRNVTLSIEDTTKTTTSNINGIATIIKVNPGTYFVKAELPTYKTIHEKLKFKRGEIIHKNYQLTKIANTTISGIVKNATSGDPLPGVAITAENSQNPIFTDRQGKFAANNIEPETYNLTFTLEGYIPKTIPVIVHGTPIYLTIELVPM